SRSATVCRGSLRFRCSNGSIASASPGASATREWCSRSELGLRIVLAVLGSLLEVPDAFADAAANIRQAICPENQDDDGQDNQEFRESDLAEHGAAFRL